MANILLLKRRILAAQNVSKTTRAMHLIATSKLKRGQDAALSQRPYAEKLKEISQNLTLRLDKDITHPYMEKDEKNNKTLLIVIAPDKGLCGGLITNLVHEIFTLDSSKNIVYIILGKKIEGAIAKQNKEIAASFKFGTTLPTFDMVYPISKLIDEYFLTKKVGSVKILSARFISVFSQTPKIVSLLPIEFLQTETKTHSKFSLFEPSTKLLLPQLLKHYLEIQIYQSLVESYAAEQAARMVAMQDATDNAREIIQELKLEYNKKRQEKITNEILDIGGGSFSYV